MTDRCINACYQQMEIDTCSAIDRYPPEIDYDHSAPDLYSVAGPQTFAGEHIQSLARDAVVLTEGLGGAPLDLFRAVDGLLHKRIGRRRYPGIINTRDAETIAADGFVSGCHDWGILAAAVLREMGVSVVFVDAVHQEYLDGVSIRGHVFLEVFDPICDGGMSCWHLYDPTAGALYTNYDPSIDSLPGGNIVYAKGVDPWEMGVCSNDILKLCLERFRTEIYEMGLACFESVDYPRIKLAAPR